jgi:hypothetical protein
MNKDFTITPKFKVCRIDETKNWREDIQKLAGGTIYGTYFYDASRQTFCCEITPSYELHFLGSVAGEGIDGFEQAEKAHDELAEGDIHTELTSYVHCRAIDAMSKEDNQDFADDNWTPTSEEHEDEESYRELLDDCISDERGNPTFT